MPLLIRAVIVIASLVGVGAAVGSLFTAMAAESKEVLSPFFMVALAILIASVGYAAGNLLRKK